MPKNLKIVEDRIRQIARETVDQMLAQGGTCDFARDVAAHYPLRVIMDILGVPPEDEPRMLMLTQQLFGPTDPELNRSREAITSADIGNIIETLPPGQYKALYAYRDAALMHHKFALIDDALLLTGSYNWTYARHAENLLSTNDPALLVAYRDEFHRLKALSMPIRKIRPAEVKPFATIPQFQNARVDLAAGPADLIVQVWTVLGSGRVEPAAAQVTLRPPPGVEASEWGGAAPLWVRLRQVGPVAPGASLGVSASTAEGGTSAFVPLVVLPPVELAVVTVPAARSCRSPSPAPTRPAR